MPRAEPSILGAGLFVEDGALAAIAAPIAVGVGPDITLPSRIAIWFSASPTRGSFVANHSGPHRRLIHSHRAGFTP